MNEAHDELTFEAILKRMLDRVPGDVDKREGSIIYTTLAPAAWEVYEAQIQRLYAIDLLIVDTSIGDTLTRLCAQYGVNRKLATKSLRKGVFTNKDQKPFNIAIGSRFGIDGLVFKVTNLLEEGIFALECETYGIIGNTSFGSILPIEYSEGLATATLTDVIVPGEDTESDDQLRNRYYERANDQSYGGNIADYKSKCRGIAGVGGCKVYPTWNGGGTVKLVIIDVNYNVPSNTLIESVQGTIDPVQSHGQGVGVAPIGHTVTVVPCTTKTYNVQATITLQNGYTWENVKVSIVEALEDYTLELKKVWADTQITIVRASKIENIMLDVVGVINVENIQINGAAGNLTLKDTEIPKLGEVTRNAN